MPEYPMSWSDAAYLRAMMQGGDEAVRSESDHRRRSGPPLPDEDPAAFHNLLVTRSREYWQRIESSGLPLPTLGVYGGHCWGRRPRDRYTSADMLIGE